MKCKDCEFCSIKYRARNTANNYGTHPRLGFSCTHDLAAETYEKMYPRTCQTYGFIGFSIAGENYPAIKTRPKWCPLGDGTKQ